MDETKSSVLRSENDRLPHFTLPTLAGKPLAYASLLRTRRIVIIALPPASTNGKPEPLREWLFAATRRAADFEERDMTVLVLHEGTNTPPELRRFPAPFIVLRDTNGAVIRQIGGAPAFYLVGKDTGIKESSRKPVPLSSLLDLIDQMPMRRQEIRERGG